MAKGNGPNPLEILGISYLQAHALRDQPNILLKVVQAVWRTLAGHFHPDVNPQAEERMKVLNIAYEKVKTLEGLERALQDFLDRGGEYLDKNLEIQALQEDKALLQQELSRNEAALSRVTQEGGFVRQILLERAFPQLADPRKFHISQAAFHLLVCEESPLSDGLSRFNLLYVDGSLRTSYTHFRYRGNVANQLDKRVGLEITRLKELLSEPLKDIASPRLPRYIYAGFLLGCWDRVFPLKSQDFLVDEFTRAAPDISPYLAFDEEVITLSERLSEAKTRRPYVRVSNMGRLRQFIPILTRPPA